MTYNYLYWEGEGTEQYDFSRGFCVPGGGTAAFLEEALAKLGLTRKEDTSPLSTRLLCLFIGIITRKRVLSHLCQEMKLQAFLKRA